MKKILILVSKYDSRKDKLTEALSKHFKRKALVNLDFLENFSCFISKNKLQGFVSGIPLSSYNLVYFSGERAFKTMPKAIAACLAQYKIPFSGYTSYTGNKFTSLVKLAQDGVDIIDTVFCSNLLVNQFELDLVKKLGFPIIIKDLFTHQSKAVYIIREEFELLSFLKKHKSGKFLFQKFIDIDHEYRILVLGSKASSAHTKITRNYAKQKVEYLDKNEEYKFVNLTDIPKQLIPKAQKAARSLALDIAGVDITLDKKGSIYVIEVNRAPGMDYEKDSPELASLVKYFSSLL